MMEMGSFNLQISYSALLCLLVVNVFCQRDVGDLCTTKKRLSGVCTEFPQCPSALANLQLGIFPDNSDTCGYSGNQPIVCCPGNTGTIITTTTPTTTPRTTPTTKSTVRTVPTPVTTPSTRAPGVRKVGDLSREKCREYKKYIIDYAAASSVGSEDCAITDVQLIVGGKPAKPKEFAHMALIGFDGESGEKKWLCGGTLISDDFVMTAGHCLFTQQYGTAKYIRVGDLVLETNVDDAEPQEFNIIQIVKHESYIPPSRYNDIALVRLHRKARLNPYVRPACLQVDRNLDLNRRPIATGWGKVGFSADTSNSLQVVTLDYYPHSQCNYSYRNTIGIALRNGILDDTQLCAGSRNESKDTCQGDSGGPLQVVHKDVFCMYSIVGITSFGRDCGVNIPGVYTRVSSYIEWIESIVWS